MQRWRGAGQVGTGIVRSIPALLLCKHTAQTSVLVALFLRCPIFWFLADGWLAMPGIQALRGCCCGGSLSFTAGFKLFFSDTSGPVAHCTAAISAKHESVRTHVLHVTHNPLSFVLYRLRVTEKPELPPTEEFDCLGTNAFYFSVTTYFREITLSLLHRKVRTWGKMINTANLSVLVW